MPVKRNKIRYTIPSSDEETSNREQEERTTQRTKAGKNHTSNVSSPANRKRVRRSVEHQRQENDQTHASSNDSSYSDPTNDSTGILATRLEGNGNFLENSSNIEQTTNSTNHTTVSFDNQYNDIESMPNTSDVSNDPLNNSSNPQTQSIIDQYFPRTSVPFDEINALHENTMDFRIRCKIISKSPIRHFGSVSKVFDAIICDLTAEIKVVAFNEDVDRLYDNMSIYQTIVIQNGKIEIANQNYRSPYSIYQIRCVSTTTIEPYTSLNFKPIMKITKQDLNSISQKIHGTTIDVEGTVISDRGIVTTTSQNTEMLVRRRVLKIKDHTGAVNITIWNDKNNDLPENMMNKTVRIRNGKINHYNDYVSINISDQTIIECFQYKLFFFSVTL